MTAGLRFTRPVSRATFRVTPEAHIQRSRANARRRLFFHALRDSLVLLDLLLNYDHENVIDAVCKDHGLCREDAKSRGLCGRQRSVAKLSYAVRAFFWRPRRALLGFADGKKPHSTSARRSNSGTVVPFSTAACLKWRISSVLKLNS